MNKNNTFKIFLKEISKKTSYENIFFKEINEIIKEKKTKNLNCFQNIQNIDVDIDLGDLLDTRINKNNTRLIYEIERNDFYQVKKLLKLGASPNKTVNKINPLNIAINNKNYKIVRILLEYGANPNSTEAGKFLKPISLLVLEISESKTNKPDVDKNKKNIKIIDILLKYGADPNSILPLGRVLSHQAVILKDLGLIKTLKKYEANFNLKDSYGKTANDYHNFTCSLKLNKN